MQHNSGPQLYVLLLLWCLPLFCISQLPKPKPNSYVSDYTGSLTEEQTGQLNKQLYVLEKQTSVQMAMLLIQDLPPNMSIEEYARAIGNTWKVGRAHNGIVYIAVLHQRKQRLEIARELEGDIPDITAAQFIDAMKPYLQQ